MIFLRYICPFYECSLTRSFAQTVLDLLSFGTIKAVANYLHVSWNLVKNIHKSKLASVYHRISLANVRYLGMDEFSIRKNHSYMTIFVDLQTGRILHAVEGRSKQNIAPFLRKVKKRAKKLKAIAMDMSKVTMKLFRVKSGKVSDIKA